MKNIVVGVDESDGSRLALQWAVREAQLHGAAVTALMSWDLLDQHHPQLEPFNPRYGQEEAEAALEAFVEAAVAGSYDVRRIATCDLPARALLEASTAADLLVTGARGVGGFPGLLVGSVARRCLQQASVPTAVVRGVVSGAATWSRPVIAGVDGSSDATAALRWAGREAAVRKVPLVALHAWAPVSTSFLGLPLANPEMLEDASRAVVQRAVEDAAVDPSAVEPRSVPGTAASVLVRESEDADLLVVGQHGHGGVLLHLLGSVAAQVADHAACTVVVVPDLDR